MVIVTKRKIFKQGGSRAVALPPNWQGKTTEFLHMIYENDSFILVIPANASEQVANIIKDSSQQLIKSILQELLSEENIQTI